jgi:hypothetical protein
MLPGFVLVSRSVGRASTKSRKSKKIWVLSGLSMMA